MEKQPHPACLELSQLTEQCDFTRTRRGGPGGQHRNKVESAIVVNHRPTGISAQASERRSQHENRAVAIERLRINLAVGFRVNGPPPESPSDRWVSRCRGKKINVSQNHTDFACLLAEALDSLVAQNFQMSAAASYLNCSTSQLIKLVKTEDSAFLWVNEQRKAREMRPLK